MIRATILDADTPAGGELIRLLIHHPDVEIENAVSADCAGERIPARHAGLIGDTDLRFIEEPDLSKTDVIFLCGTSPLPDGIADDVRVIDLTGRFMGTDSYVLGIGELNRKAMVRGATRATIPSAATQGAVVALLPLAKHALLKGEITVSDGDIDIIAEALKTLQPDLDATIVRGCETETTVTVTISSMLETAGLRDMYEEAFDDHNFTYLIDRMPVAADVCNTNKCLLHLTASDGAVTVNALMDANIKGCAGTAVHCMNLLFGLHEVIGLQLKALGR